MAGQHGPFVEPGWPSSLPGQPDIGGAFMKGMALTAEIGRRRQQLENALVEQSLKMRRFELDSQLKEDRYNLAVERMVSQNELARERLDIARDRNADLAFYAGERERRLQETADRKLETANNIEEAMVNLQNLPIELEKEGYRKGTDEYLNQLRSRGAPWVSKLPTSSRNAWDRIASKEHNDARKFQLNMLESDEKAFAHDYGRSITGDDLNIDLAPILHQEQLPSETTGGWFAPKKTTGKKIIMAKTPEGIKPRAVSVEELNKFKKRYQDLQERRKRIGTAIDRPDLGVYSTGEAQAMPANKADLRSGVVYVTPKGNLRWTGTGFVAP